MKFMTIFLTVLLTPLGCASKSSKQNQERAALHMQIGTGFLAKGLYPQAMTELLRAQQLDPKNPYVLNNLGISYYVRGREKQAEAKFREAIKYESKFSDAKNNLARALIDQKRYNEALKWLNEVEGDLTYQAPEKTYSNMGIAYFEMGNYMKAGQYLERSMQIRRESCTTASYYGRTLYETKKIKESAEMLDQAIEYCRSTKFEDPLYISALSYFSLGQKEKTRARIDELLKDYPKSKYVAKAKGMLELLEQ